MWVSLLWVPCGSLAGEPEAVQKMVAKMAGQRALTRGLTFRGGEPNKIKTVTRSVVLSPEAAQGIPRGSATILGVIEEDIGPQILNPADDEPDESPSSDPAAPPEPPQPDEKRSKPEVRINSAPSKPATTPTPAASFQQITVPKIAAPKVAGSSKPPVSSPNNHEPPTQPAYKITYQVDEQASLKGEVRFAADSTEIVGKGSQVFLENLSVALVDPTLKDFTFVIEGHASAEGDEDYNQRLSQRRANKIFWILVKEHGIEPKRLLPIGFGEKEAAAPEGAPEIVLQRDRRVMIEKIDR